MLRILPAVLAALVLVSIGLAAGPDETRVMPPTPHAQVAKRTVSATHRVLPKLVLPNISREVRRLQAADRAVAARQLTASQNVIRFWSNHQWILAPRKDKCWQVPWQRSCTVARASLRLHTKLSEAARVKLDREIPLINDWLTAVHWVQRIYPGTESWMRYISDREGGWGPWVWYGGRTWSGYHVGNDFLGADTVGGWMQFRYSTFAPYWRGAQKDLRARGYLIPSIPMPAAGGPSEYAAWLSPLGQALTAGYMRYYGKDGCHWCL